MNYTNKTFSVHAPGTDEYRKRWEQTFRPKCTCKMETTTEIPAPGPNGQGCSFSRLEIDANPKCPIHGEGA